MTEPRCCQNDQKMETSAASRLKRRAEGKPARPPLKLNFNRTLWEKTDGGNGFYWLSVSGSFPQIEGVPGGKGGGCGPRYGDRY